jgi:hypothetical protein
MIANNQLQPPPRNDAVPLSEVNATDEHYTDRISRTPSIRGNLFTPFQDVPVTPWQARPLDKIPTTNTIAPRVIALLLESERAQTWNTTGMSWQLNLGLPALRDNSVLLFRSLTIIDTVSAPAATYLIGIRGFPTMTYSTASDFSLYNFRVALVNRSSVAANAVYEPVGAYAPQATISSIQALQNARVHLEVLDGTGSAIAATTRIRLDFLIREPGGTYI